MAPVKGLGPDLTYRALLALYNRLWILDEQLYEKQFELADEAGRAQGTTQYPAALARYNAARRAYEEANTAWQETGRRLEAEIKKLRMPAPGAVERRNKLLFKFPERGPGHPGFRFKANIQLDPSQVEDIRPKVVVKNGVRVNVRHLRKGRR